MPAPETAITQTSRNGDTGWFQHEGKSHHIYLRDYKGRCCAHIYSPLGNGHSIPGQCGNKGSKKYGDYLFCGTHYPPSVARRDATRAEQRRLEREENSRLWKERANADKMLRDALAAIKLIAAGHNDPRALAMEVLNPTDGAEPDTAKAVTK